MCIHASAIIQAPARHLSGTHLSEGLQKPFLLCVGEPVQTLHRTVSLAQIDLDRVMTTTLPSVVGTVHGLLCIATLQKTYLSTRCTRAAAEHSRSVGAHVLLDKTQLDKGDVGCPSCKVSRRFLSMGLFV